MKVQIQLFAVARDRLGRSSVEVELPERSSVGELRSRLIIAFSDLADIVPRAMLAVDAEYASDDQPLQCGSEIALIPPVSGG